MDALDLSSLFKTKSQALDFATRLAAFSQDVYGTGFNVEQSLAKHFSLQQKDKLLRLLGTQNIDFTKASTLKEFVSKLQTEIYSLPVLSLSLAFEPKEKTLTILSDWFHLKIKRQVLFDITVDPSLIAGIVIHFNGRFLDYSIRDRFTKIMSETLTPPAASTKPA